MPSSLCFLVYTVCKCDCSVAFALPVLCVCLRNPKVAVADSNKRTAAWFACQDVNKRTPVKPSSGIYNICYILHLCEIIFILIIMSSIYIAYTCVRKIVSIIATLVSIFVHFGWHHAWWKYQWLSLSIYYNFNILLSWWASIELSWINYEYLS